MPGGDRTGPRGLGLMTGRRAGTCAGSDMPGFANPVPGYGMRFGGRFGGRGWGHGRRHGFYATGRPFWSYTGAIAPASEQELNNLKDEADRLKSDLEAINRRIEELEQK